MKNFFAWWKEEKRYMRLIKAGVAALLPILCCLVYCAVQGRGITQVYLPASPWNDELFYFKQVEAIVDHGYPLGYYGFNESHALKLSFAAWSPVLVFPWIVWGKLFGWGLLSPVICNILLLTLACFLFVWLTEADWKQIGVLALLFALFPLFVRYMLSGMPEIICMSMLIIFYGLSVNYLHRDKGYKLAILLLMASLMVLMRPYMLLFLLLPIGLWVKRSGKKGVAGSVILLVVVLGAYAAIKHYLSAEYFAPLFFTDWITTFFTEGLAAGIKNFFGTLYYMGSNFYAYTLEGFKTGWTAGAFFGGYLLILAILLVHSVRNYRKKEYKQLVINGHLAFSFVGMFFALLLMYKLIEGSKHLLTFMAAGIFVISLMETKFYKKAVLLGVVFAYLYTYQANDPYDYQVPFAQEEQVARIGYWEDVFAEQLEPDKEIKPDFRNSIIWDFQAKREGEEYTNLKWQLLYALPSGMGISCCRPDYVEAHLEEMNCRYIATVSGGATDIRCRELGYAELGRDADMVVYKRY